MPKPTSITTSSGIFWGSIGWASKEDGSGVDLNKTIGHGTYVFDKIACDAFEADTPVVSYSEAVPKQKTDTEKGAAIGAAVGSVLALIPDLLLGSGERNCRNDNFDQFIEHGLVGHLAAGALGASNMIAQGALGTIGVVVAFIFSVFPPILYFVYDTKEYMTGKQFTDFWECGCAIGKGLVQELAGTIVRAAMVVLRAPSLLIKGTCTLLGAAIGGAKGLCSAAKKQFTKIKLPFLQK